MDHERPESINSQTQLGRFSKLRGSIKAHKSRSDKRQTHQGPMIEDVTDTHDEGYIADNETVGPDGFEEPPESDRESVRSVQVQQRPSNQSSLIKHFRKLRCGRKNDVSLPMRPKQGDARVSMLKRRRSKESFTSEEPAGQTLQSSDRHSRKRPTLSPPSMAQAELMDLDDESQLMV